LSWELVRNEELVEEVARTEMLRRGERVERGLSDGGKR
jgi:hypothetical protein